MNIVGPLADHPDAVPTIARWLFDEWGHRSPDRTVAGMQNILYERLHRKKLPLALVALREGVPIGTVSLKIQEVEIRPQFEHWLGSLYVAKPYRKMGVGSLLIRSAQDTGRNLGIEELYLYTRNTQNQHLYEKLGWVEVERPEYRQHPAIIMRTDLNDE